MTHCCHLYIINTWQEDVIEYWVYLMLNMRCYDVICNRKPGLSVHRQRGIHYLYWLMITQSIIVDFLSITLMAYWTCQFAFSSVCESPRCCERPFHYEQLITSRAVNCLNSAAEFARSSFPLEKKHSNQRRDFWGSGCRKQMLLLEQRQPEQETEDPDGALHLNRKREMFAF